MMTTKSSGKFSSFFSSTTTLTYGFYNDHTSPPQQTPITVVHPPQSDAASATKIQSAYRAHLIRTLYKTISSVNSEADQLQRHIQRQETVDAIMTDGREKLRMNEALMALLLRLDSVPGVNPTVRDARRKVSRRIVGLQEILDAICGAKLGGGVVVGYGYGDVGVGGFLGNWDQMLAEMEEEVCRQRGGDEMEKFCAQYLGFRCLQRFLREP